MKTTTRNLFRSSVAALIMGKVPNVRFISDNDRQRVYEGVIHASRNLLEVLEKKDADSALVSEALDAKRTAADIFKKKFGFYWPF